MRTIKGRGMNVWRCEDLSFLIVFLKLLLGYRSTSPDEYESKSNQEPKAKLSLSAPSLV